MKLLAGTIFLAVCLNAADDTALQSAFEEHQWFDLRDSVVSGSAPPELRFNLGAFPVVLHESPALLSSTIPQSERYEGQLGMDAMAQAAELTYDLRAMKTTLK